MPNEHQYKRRVSEHSSALHSYADYSEHS